MQRHGAKRGLNSMAAHLWTVFVLVELKTDLLPASLSKCLSSNQAVCYIKIAGREAIMHCTKD